MSWPDKYDPLLKGVVIDLVLVFLLWRFGQTLVVKQSASKFVVPMAVTCNQHNIMPDARLRFGLAGLQLVAGDYGSLYKM